MRPTKSSKRSKSKAKTSKTLVNWLDLPRDLMIQIFLKVGTLELLRNAQRVCSSWLEIAKDPQLYRVIDFYNSWEYFNDLESVENMAKLAIDRSRGGLVEFSIEYFWTGAILDEIADKAPKLMCLRMADCSRGFGFDDHLIGVIEKLPLLEEVEFIFPWIDPQVLEAVGRSCTKLRSFRLNGKGVKLNVSDGMFTLLGEWFNNEAFAIADNLNPALRSLHLLGNLMKNNGLEAILERFTQLEYLDLRRCVYLDLKGDLLRKCQGIKTLRLPDDSIEDCQFLEAERFKYFGWKCGSENSC